LPAVDKNSKLTFMCVHGLGGELDQFSEQFAFLARYPPPSSILQATTTLTPWDDIALSLATLLPLSCSDPRFGNVVALDFVGHGQSPESEIASDYETEAIVDDLEAVFDKNHTETNIIVGHSYGTSIPPTLLSPPPLPLPK